MPEVVESLYGEQAIADLEQYLLSNEQEIYHKMNDFETLHKVFVHYIGREPKDG